MFHELLGYLNERVMVLTVTYEAETVKGLWENARYKLDNMEKMCPNVTEFSGWKDR